VPPSCVRFRAARPQPKVSPSVRPPKKSKIVPTLTSLPVRHRLLLINAHRSGIYGPSLNGNTITRYAQRTLPGDNPKGAFPCVLPVIAAPTQA
jgi:hypothetical protein